jgi:hypothetical protein
MGELARPARGYTWEPFQKGNEVALTHGADTKRPDHLADLYFARFLEDESTPAYLRDWSYAEAIRAYCRTLAMIKLMWDFAAAQGIEVAMVDKSTEDETEIRTYDKVGDGDQGGKGGSRRKTARRTVSDHVTSVLSRLDRLETRAMQQRIGLGLDPRSRAALGRDVASQRFDLAQTIAALDKVQQAGA